MANVVVLVAALIGAVATIAGAVITTRRNGPAGVTTVSDAHLFQGRGWAGEQVVAAVSKRTKAFGLGIAGLICWVLPIAGFCVTIPGLWIAIRDLNGPKRSTTAGLVMCGIGFALTLVNSAIGAYQGAHGQMWFQHG